MWGKLDIEWKETFVLQYMNDCKVSLHQVIDDNNHADNDYNDVYDDDDDDVYDDDDHTDNGRL